MIKQNVLIMMTIVSPVSLLVGMTIENSDVMLRRFITEGTPESIGALLENGRIPSINSKDRQGQTMLMHAASLNKKNLVEYLINKGADFTIKDSQGNTALDHARQVKKKFVTDSEKRTGKEVRTLLKEAPKQKMLKEKERHEAEKREASRQRERNEMEKREALRQEKERREEEKRKTIRQREEAKETQEAQRVLLAREQEAREEEHRLREKERNFAMQQIQFTQRHEAEKYALFHHNHEASLLKDPQPVFIRLVSKPKEQFSTITDLNQCDIHGRTLLMYAVAYKKPDLVQYLISKGADISRKDDQGVTALDYAHKTHDHKLISLLTSLSRDEEGKMNPFHPQEGQIEGEVEGMPHRQNDEEDDEQPGLPRA